MVAKGQSHLLSAMALMFPSPCGVMVAKVEILAGPDKGLTVVSVPLRGNGCESIDKSTREKGITLGVSVPLRGNGCESLQAGEQAFIYANQFSFRPLAG